jgi:hypothetical protein
LWEVWVSDFYIFESADSEYVVICERGPEGELPFATVFPGVPMSVPARAEVRALARARAERIIEALTAEDADLPTSGKSFAEMVQDATGIPECWKAQADDALDPLSIGAPCPPVALVNLVRWPFREE